MTVICTGAQIKTAILLRMVKHTVTFHRVLTLEQKDGHFLEMISNLEDNKQYIFHVSLDTYKYIPRDTDSLGETSAIGDCKISIHPLEIYVIQNMFKHELIDERDKEMLRRAWKGETEVGRTI